MRPRFGLLYRPFRFSSPVSITTSTGETCTGFLSIVFEIFTSIRHNPSAFEVFVFIHRRYSPSSLVGEYSSPGLVTRVSTITLKREILLKMAMRTVLSRVPRVSRLACLRTLSTEGALPRVFFDIEADGEELGRVVMEVSQFYRISRLC